MADASKIQGYNIKDASARASISNLQQSVSNLESAVGDCVKSVAGTNSATATEDASGNVTVDVSYITTGKAANTTVGTRSTVEGMSNTVDAPVSHAEGTQNTINVSASQGGHAEGTSNTVNGINGHAEGYNNTVGGQHSHAEGSGNTTTGDYSHAGGTGSVAGGNGSMATGYHTKTTNTGELAVGSYNKSDSMTMFSVGNGNADNNRSNLFEVTSSGSVMNSGELHTGDDVYIGGQNIYINNASDVQKELSIDANNQLCIDSVPISGGGGSTVTYDFKISSNENGIIWGSSTAVAPKTIYDSITNGDNVIVRLQASSYPDVWIIGLPVIQVSYQNVNSIKITFIGYHSGLNRYEIYTLISTGEASTNTSTTAWTVPQGNYGLSSGNIYQFIRNIVSNWVLPFRSGIRYSSSTCDTPQFASFSNVSYAPESPSGNTGVYGWCLGYGSNKIAFIQGEKGVVYLRDDNVNTTWAKYDLNKLNDAPIITSPNNTQYRITVDDNGNLSTTTV